MREIAPVAAERTLLSREDRPGPRGLQLAARDRTAHRSAALAQTEPEVDFASQLRPLFASYCYECHGPDRAKREADLRLDRRQFVLADLGAGFYPIVPGDGALRLEPVEAPE